MRTNFLFIQSLLLLSSSLIQTSSGRFYSKRTTKKPLVEFLRFQESIFYGIHSLRSTLKDPIFLISLHFSVPILFCLGLKTCDHWFSFLPT
jgi:hypothetical protein